MPADVGLRELLESGVHFGHQTRRWNPKMRRFIHGERDGIYLIDLLKTERMLSDAQNFASEIAGRGGTVLFVGTKKQAKDAIKEAAEAAGQPYVHNRWLGGLLTNFQTISLRIKRLHDLERYEREGQLELLPTRERLNAVADLEKLRNNLGGVKNMTRIPQAMFVIDLKTEVIAVREAQRLRIPIIGLVDTNCDPDGIDFVVPGNDDAIRSCGLIARAIGDTVAEGNAQFRQAEQERQQREQEEQARREAEQLAAREAEEQAKREAEAQAEAERQAKLTQAEGGGDRQAAEAEVAEAVAEGGRPQPDPVVNQSANTEVATPDKANQEPSPTQATPAEADEPVKTADAGASEETQTPVAPASADTGDAQSPKTDDNIDVQETKS
ncbi:MAG TPA: 30S ribosomal protein S2 [Solirubrobacteraceae bacterium]|nr:30S ribosomal protein S2 [Solirubrobacteraceae bacterium]